MDTTLITTTGVLPPSGRHRFAITEPATARRVAHAGPWALVGVLAIPTAWVDLYVAARTIDLWGVWALAVAGQSLAVCRAAATVRRAAAGRLFPTKAANRRAGQFLGALILLPYGNYAEQHRNARLAARRADGSAWALDGTGMTGLAVDATARRAGGYEAWREAFRVLAGESHDETHSRPQIRSTLVSVISCVWMLSVALVGLRLMPGAWLVGWLLPLSIGSAAAFVMGRFGRRTRVAVDRRTIAFDVVDSSPLPAIQPIKPRSRNWAISAGS